MVAPITNTDYMLDVTDKPFLKCKILHYIRVIAMQSTFRRRLNALLYQIAL